MCASALLNVAYHSIWPPSLPWTVVPLMIYTIGMSTAMPSITILVLDLFPENRGLAASLQGAQQSLFTGLAAGLLSPFVAGTGIGLAGSMLLLVIGGLACWFAFARLPMAKRPIR